MPLLRKQAFVREKTPSNLKATDEVFHCKITNEIFTDYEKFFERIILCNSLVWTCAETGRPGLTFQEALESEAKAKKLIKDFPENLVKPILFLASKTHRSRINDVVDDVFGYSKDRYFVNEIVEVLHDDEKKACKVMKVIAADEKKPPAIKEKEDVIILDSDEEEDVPLSKLQKSPRKEAKVSDFGNPSETFQYVVQEIKKANIYIVHAKQVSRKKGPYTKDKCKLFLKKHSEPDFLGIWRVKKQSKKRHRLDDLIWREYFDGPLPKFGISKSKKAGHTVDLTNEASMIKQAKKERKEKKKLEKDMKKMEKEKKKEIKKALKGEERKRLKEEKQRLKEIRERQATLEEKLKKMTPDERLAYKEKIKQEKLAEKMAKKEEMKKEMEEKRQKLKEEREKLKEKKKEEEMKRKEVLREYNKPRDDLQCDDLKPLPRAKPVQSRVPSEYFGDAVMVLEYLTCFNTLLEMENQFPHKISLDALGDALQDASVNGLYADLVSFLLTTIFQLEEEEEEYDDEEDVEDADDVKAEQTDVSFRDMVKQATIAAQIPQQNYGTPLNKLHIDGFTLTEILRLHFLASGAKGSERNSRFRYTQRGGYSSTDDAGLEFKMQETAVIKSLSESNMFDLNPGDKLKILIALIHQLLTYVACRDVIEENFETMRTTRNELRAHQLAESRQQKDEAHFWWKKRVDERKKEQEQKAKEKEEKKNKNEQQKPGENKDGDVVDLCDSRPDSRGPDSQSNSRAPTPSGSPEDNKKGTRGKGSSIKAMIEQRHSSRLKDKDGTTEDDFSLDNIEWDKVTPDDRIAMRNRFEKKEMELFDAISELQHSNAVHSLGSDRTFRRYWVFRSIDGVFVEDGEDQVPDDYYDDLVEQTIESQASFKSENLPLVKNENGEVVKEEKCASSDKENESFDQNKAAVEAMDTSESIPKEQNEVIEISSDTSKSNTPIPDIVVTDTADSDESSKLNLISVYDQIKSRNQVRWSFYNTPEELDTLINNLNARGYREGPLKTALQEQKRYIADNIGNCPMEMLSISEQESAESTVRFQKVKSRNRNVQGAVKNASASEFLELNLREQLLDLEERIFVGGLGALKLKERKPWRDAIECGNYDPQCDSITWGASSQTTTVKARFKNSPSKMNGDVVGENGVDKTEDVEDDDLAILVVRDMSRAVVQISQMLEPKFLKPPLGEDDEIRNRKQKEALELAFQGLTPRKIKAKIWDRKPLKKIKEEGGEEGDQEEKMNEEADGEEEEYKKTGMERWQESLMACCSLSQVFLHLSVLDQSIIWDKSALHARCKICRRKGDDEKMLLCDGCDGGYHMYCLKPPMKRIPKDDWYCIRCKPKDVSVPKIRRKSTFSEEPEEMDTTKETEDEEEESSDDEEDSDEEDDDETEEDTDEDTDAYDEDTEIDDQEEQPTKIKFLKGFKSKGGRSGGDSDKNSSRGGSARSSRSNTPTRNTPPKSGKNRTSLEKAIQLKAVATKSNKGGGGEKRKSSRHSIETEQPSARKSSRQQQEEPRSGRTSRLSLDPSSSRAAKRQSDMDEYDESPAAKNRRRGSDKVNVMRACEDLLTELSKRDESWPFQAPVTRRDAPDYFDVIKTPMDFGTIRKKLFEVEYGSPDECLADMRLVFSNCALYNMPLAPEFVAGEKLSRFFEKRVKELGLEPKGSASKGRPGSPTKGSPSARGSRSKKY